MTETSAGATLGHGGANKIGSVGKPLLELSLGLLTLMREVTEKSNSEEGM